MNLVYIIGPSGAGKSSLCEKLAGLDPQYIHFSLDDEVKKLSGVQHLTEIIRQPNDWEKFWTHCSQVIENIYRTGLESHIYLVDVGAGALETPIGREYFIGHAKQLICIMGSEDVVYTRNQEKLARSGASRTKDQFLHTEYSDERQSVYNAAQIRIDTSKGDVAVSLAEFEKAIISQMQN
ncbi:MAG: hypothetical protein K8L91_02525 [Anaerolineae bacterium]|nr:hypothetical protein [Anaerolineae bacterium]